MDVIIHEKHDTIGHNYDGRKCGEAHCIESFSLKWKPPKEAIASTIYCGKAIAGDKTFIVDRKPDTAWVLDRQEFIASLGKKARKMNINISLNDKISSIGSLTGDIIVDASGCPSVVKKELGLKTRYIGYGYQQTITHCSAFEPHTLKIIFEENGGYYWIFPRHPEKKEVNLGIGLLSNKKTQLPQLLNQFKKNHNITGSVDHSIGGLIPTGLQYPLRYKNILFVGDTGVGTLPMSGQGIYRALISGDIAGKYIIKQNLKGYAKEIIREFIKMDVLGKFIVNWNELMYHINPHLIFSTWKRYYSLNNRFSFFKSDFDNIHYD